MSHQASAHRWYVLGLREVHKAVRTRRARCVVVAPNIEEVEAEGGLDTTLQAILDMWVTGGRREGGRAGGRGARAGGEGWGGGAWKGTEMVTVSL